MSRVMCAAVLFVLACARPGAPEPASDPGAAVNAAVARSGAVFQDAERPVPSKAEAILGELSRAAKSPPAAAADYDPCRWMPADLYLQGTLQWHLGSLGPGALPALQAAWEGADEKTRPWLAMALARLGDDRGLGTLQPLLASEAPLLRMYAAEALGRLRHAESGDALEKLLGDAYEVPPCGKRHRPLRPVADAAAGALWQLGYDVRPLEDGGFEMRGRP